MQSNKCIYLNIYLQEPENVLIKMISNISYSHFISGILRIFYKLYRILLFQEGSIIIFSFPQEMYGGKMIHIKLLSLVSIQDSEWPRSKLFSFPGYLPCKGAKLETITSFKKDCFSLAILAQQIKCSLQTEGS